MHSASMDSRDSVERLDEGGDDFEAESAMTSRD